MEKRRTRRKKNRRARLLVPLAVLLVLLAGAAFLLTRYTVLGGQALRLDAAVLDLSDAGLSSLAGLERFTALRELDLRGNPLAAAEVEAFIDAHPSCAVRWSVPLGQQRFDSESREIRTGAILAEEAPLLADFPLLTYADVSGSDCYAALIETAAVLPGCTVYYTVPVAGLRVDSLAETVDLSGRALDADALNAAFAALPKLRAADIRGGGLAFADARALVGAFPDISFAWEAELFGRTLDMGADTLDLAGIAQMDAETLRLLLDCCKPGTAVDLTGSAISGDAGLALCDAYPLLAIAVDFTLCGASVNTAQTALELSGCALDPAALDAAMRHMPALTSVTLLGCGVTNADMGARVAAYPGIEFRWDFTLYGKTVDTDAALLDLSGEQIADTGALEAAMPYLTKLTQVEMCNCGVPNEAMAALSERYPSVKFVWTVKIGRFLIRTDMNAYGTEVNKNIIKTRLTDADLENLRYCTDLVALDLGHNSIGDLTVIGTLDKLQILILGDNRVSDLSPLAACTELVYLELFMNDVTDVTPLTGLEKLEYLCITSNEVKNASLFTQMTGLKRLWLRGNGISAATVETIRSALPECWVNNTDYGTGGGWRSDDDPVYTWMRAYFTLYGAPDGVHVTEVGF